MPPILFATSTEEGSVQAMTSTTKFGVFFALFCFILLITLYVCVAFGISPRVMSRAVKHYILSGRFRRGSVTATGPTSTYRNGPRPHQVGTMSHDAFFPPPSVMAPNAFALRLPDYETATSSCPSPAYSLYPPSPSYSYPPSLSPSIAELPTPPQSHIPLHIHNPSDPLFHPPVENWMGYLDLSAVNAPRPECALALEPITITIEPDVEPMLSPLETEEGSTILLFDHGFADGGCHFHL